MNENHWVIKNGGNFPDGYDPNCRICLDEIEEMKRISKLHDKIRQTLAALGET